jgi:preprotein translocase subunit SecG
MQTVLIVIHLMIVLALVGIVLVQRSEGGGLGIGGGSGFMSARGAANALTRTTGILAAAFFVTSLSHGAIYFHHRRRGFLPWKRPGISSSRRFLQARGYIRSG